MYIYLAGPMQVSNRFINLRRALDAAERIELRGHTCFIPHLNEFWDLVHPHKDDFWMKRDFLWIRKCDVLVRLNGVSKDSDTEVELANRLDIPIFGSEIENGLELFMNSQYWGKV